jgi:ribose transport system permease protein
VSYLLPAYAAVFLGSASFRPGQFNVIGTVVAVIFLGVVQTGLQMMQIQTAWILILQGVILIVAIQANRIERQG